MKIFRLLLIVMSVVCVSKNATAQDVMLNILTQNSGRVNINEQVFLEITVCNTNATVTVPVYKLKPQISFPSAIVSIPHSGHVLPAGWALTFNEGAVIKLSNGTDQVPPGQCRTILILMKGKASGGPSTISANLNFSNGVAPGTLSGSATPGDNPADNASTTTIQVTN
ncbi:hypothetical protein BH11BAC4_BH11BAC4_04610 [soil metagenome]